MKKFSYLLLLAVAFAFVGCDSDDDKEIVHVLDLPGYAAETTYTGDIKNALESWVVGEGEDWEFTNYLTSITDNSKVFSFDCITSQPGNVGAGYGFSNKKSGYDSAITKKGIAGDTYIISYYDSYSNKERPTAIKFVDNDNKPKTSIVSGLYVTNAYTTVDVIENGSDLGPTDKFKDGDWFKITIFNYNKTKSLDFYLADFRNGKSEIVKEWKWVDLTSLGETNGLKFELSSSSNNTAGMLTPAYFCLDGIKIVER